MLDQESQVKEFIAKAKEILIAFRHEESGDAIATSLALAGMLGKMGKQVTVASSGFVAEKRYQFLPGIEKIMSALPLRRKFLISLDVSKTKVDELSYDLKDDQLLITILPSGGSFSAKDVVARSEGPLFDLIITVSTPDLSALGTLFDEEPDFFYRTPIINIDHHAENEHYGQVNMVDLVASSSAEIVALLAPNALGQELMDESVHTQLLAGMISETKSFQEHATPRALSLAASLVERGGKRDEIVRNLYQTKSLGTLRLWGRTLARLKVDQGSGIVWSLLSRDDFDKAGGSADDLPEVIEDLIFSSPEAHIGCILFEKGENTIGGIVQTSQESDALTLAKPFRAEGSRTVAHFTLEGKKLLEAEQEVIEVLKARGEKRKTA